MAENAKRTSKKGASRYILTDEELAAVEAEAQQHVADESRKLALKEAQERATRAARIAAGLEDVDPNVEKVRIVLDLPENITPEPCFTVDGQKFYERTPYTVSINVARSLLDMQARAWENDSREKGKWHDPRAISRRGGMDSFA